MDRSLSPQEPHVQSSHEEAKQTGRFELHKITAHNIHSPLTDFCSSSMAHVFSVGHSLGYLNHTWTQVSWH